ncbi:DNA polymerase III subunit beta [endosymbiont of Sipalinus gigas]|uniref:DNA polymerase III subunit beta n=1 Tax=endosymbiont of Sipalinus gigas TaxID=1972134 RepID=UPI000DC7165A|nr:DNA polymerase III subunit beta [endosymbiont of Sipalinus gigas]BBA85160.1 DNA polymerase III subunit beta [endosymbiont of Sipalinus gigas]
MKLCVDRDILIRSLKYISSIIYYTQNLDIIKNILLIIKDKNLKIIGTNLEIEISINIPLLECNKNDKFLVSIKKLLNICKVTKPKTFIYINKEDNFLLINFNRSNFNILTLSSINFPIFNESKIKLEICISKNTLILLIKKTQFAMGNNDIRRYLNSIFFEIYNNKIISVATDGHRLSSYKVNINNGPEKKISILLSRKVVIEIYKLLNNLDNLYDNINIYICETNICIIINNIKFLSLIMNNTFPNYINIILENKNNFIIINKENLKNSILRVLSISDNKFCCIKLKINKNNLIIKLSNSYKEKAKEIININDSSNIKSDYEFGFNSKYILDVLHILESDKIKIHFSDNLSSIRIEDINDINSNNIIMPIKL